MVRPVDRRPGYHHPLTRHVSIRRNWLCERRHADSTPPSRAKDTLSEKPPRAARDLVVQSLKQSARNAVDEAVVLSQLAPTFPHERPRRLLHTVVAWARYAALFKYNSTRRVLHGVQQPVATP